MTVTDRLEGAVPLAGVTASHVASSDAVNDSVPAPVLATDRFWAGGLAAPWVAPNDRLAGVTDSAGGGAAPASA